MGGTAERPAQSGEQASKADVERYRANAQAEVDSASVYRTLAEVESSPHLAELYQRLADTEDEHADFWLETLESTGESAERPSPSWRARVLSWVARRFGPDAVLPTLRGAEAGDTSGYATQTESRDTSLPTDEESHARLLSAIDAPTGMEGGTLARLEGRHRTTSGNALRAAVLGANDGLVSNLSLVMGVTGAALAAQTILVTGLAGLLAGAGSMAMGEWLSVQSSRELYERQIAVEREELRAVPDEEETELALIYQAKGLPEEQARSLAERLVADRDTALDTLSREELGIDPEELGGSAVEAAVTSFVLFALGAIVPVVPFVAFAGTTAVVTSLFVSGVALFVIGAGITVLTGRSALYSGGRQVVVGLAAAALTFVVGRLIGVAVVG
ncbi:VIT1/CCC1 transporter family protein [Halorussus halophilus]|uniref:VIT1/CCC1 transporter family protein n=1 Tax=Halorussus halophilus TaxID=2650975 RepID=UPI001301317A|nr:VIT1/CCC1 family protein [Halorussus halophilus]